MKRKNAFTLIELIAVLVILAILALIVTPLVLNIVRNAKDSANKRSVDAYGKAVELSIATYLLDTGEFPTNMNDLIIEYTGSEVVCKIQQLNEDSSIFLSECTVGGKEVKDSSTDDGWYHYGKMDKVVYKTYSIGDEVTYNGMNFYVIADSDENSDSVTMLKADPLTVDEVDTYGNGQINKYPYWQSIIVGKAYDLNGYGAMAYYSSSNCGYLNHSSDSLTTTGCTTDYDKSDIKRVVDAWATDKLRASDLNVDATGYSARLLTFDELINNLGFSESGGTIYPSQNSDTPSWAYSSNYFYWTMSSCNDSNTSVWRVSGSDVGSRSSGGAVFSIGNDKYGSYLVRPVINLKKNSI